MHPGDLIGAYRIDVVGIADFAVTHLATQRQARLRWVAPAVDAAEFVQAARRVCGLSAPTLHGLIDAGIENQRCYLVDALPNGEALVDHIGRVGALSGDALLAFAESLFSALIELHNRELFDGALHLGRVRVVEGRACVTEPGVGRFLPALTPPPEFADPALQGVAADLFAAAALVCFAAQGRALSPATATLSTGLAQPIVALLQACLGIEGERPKADAVRRTIEAVRAGTLAPDGENADDGGDWITDATVAPPTPQQFDAARVPDELPTARAPLGHIAPPEPDRAPRPPDRPAQAPEREPAPAARALSSRARTPPPPAKSTNAGVFVAAALVVLGVGGVIAWRTLAPLPETPSDPPQMPVTSTPTQSPVSAATAASTPSAAPETLDRYAHVTLVVQPGPARFVQVESKTVVCESALICQVPIDVDTRVEKEGYTPRVLSGDDLYDQRGNRWTIRLRTVP